jgi:hypothetical protein
MATNLITTVQTSTINGITGSSLAIGTNLTTETLQLGNTGTTITLRGPITAQTLSVTGVTTATGGLQTSIPTTMTYTTIPTFTSQQIGFTIKSVLAADATVAATNVASNPFSATTFTLTPGVWLLNNQVSLKGSTGTTTITIQAMDHSLTTAQSNQVTSYGITNTPISTIVTPTLIYTINESYIIFNNTASNNVLINYTFTYTPPSLLRYVANDTFLMFTRIA